MLVITLHGFGTTGEGSTICQKIHTLLTDNDAISYVPTYPTNNPHLANIYLTNFISEKVRDHGQNPIIIGFDIGGFWARFLANITLPGKLILINPDLRPWESLLPYAGENINNYTGKVFELANNDITAYELYKIQKDVIGLKVDLLLSNNSKLIDIETIQNTFAQIENVEIFNDDHSFSNNRQAIVDTIQAWVFPDENYSAKTDK